MKSGKILFANGASKMQKIFFAFSSPACPAYRQAGGRQGVSKQKI